MTEKRYEDICKPHLINGAILHTHFPFVKDYLCIHALIKKYKPKTFLEIGTNIGEGTNIICNANPSMKVYSLDLPYELSNLSRQSPISEGKGRTTGSKCAFPFTQLWGNSMAYDYSKHIPIDAFYIDGEHTYGHVIYDTNSAVESGSKLIIWHDANMDCVKDAIIDYFKLNKNYSLFQIKDTRIGYALKKI